MPSALSVRDLAVRLDVSPATVSEALRGSPRVKTATRLRIVAEAERLGYRANPLASALMTEMRRSRNGTFRGTLALLDPETAADRPASFTTHRHELATGARERAGQLGFHIDSFSLLAPGLVPEALTEVLDARGINGVLILPACAPAPCADLDWSRLSVIRADCSVDRSVLHAIHTDHTQAMSLALDELQARGFRRPGLILQTELGEHALHRWEAACHAHFLRRRPGGEIHDAHGRPAPLVTRSVHAAELRVWLESERPDVVLAHDLSILAALREARPAPARPPSFFCLDLPPGPAVCAGLDLRPRAIGRRAMEMLVDQVLRRQHGAPALPVLTLVPAACITPKASPESASHGLWPDLCARTTE